MKRPRNAGNTVLIIAIVAGSLSLGMSPIVFQPTIRKLLVGDQERAFCTANLRELGRAVLRYQHDHGTLPPRDGIDFLESFHDKGDGVLNPGTLICKAEEVVPTRRGKALTTANVAFLAYRNRTVPLPIAEFDREGSRIPIAADRNGETHGGVYQVLFWDGHVETIDREGFENEIQTGGFMDGKTLQSVLSD